MITCEQNHISWKEIFVLNPADVSYSNFLPLNFDKLSVPKDHSLEGMVQLLVRLPSLKILKAYIT